MKMTMAKLPFLMLALVAGPFLGGCAADKTFALACSEYIGNPVPAVVAEQSDPRPVTRVSRSTQGYVYESAQTRFIGGERYYEVNYLTGVDNKRTAIRPVTTTCEGNFVRPVDPRKTREVTIDVVPGVRS
ncbi:hypothetical protein AB4099_28080 [Bosea sp. 2KB_26]